MKSPATPIAEAANFAALLTPPSGATGGRDAARERARATWEQLGPPSSKHEEWRFTDTRAVKELRPVAAPPPNGNIQALVGQALGLAGVAAHRVVLVDGWYASALSSVGHLPPAFSIGPLAQAPAVPASQTDESADPSLAFAQLNRAGYADGTLVNLGAGAPALPVYVLHLSTGAVPQQGAQPRLVVQAGPNTQLTVIEHYLSLGDKSSFTNALTEVSVGPGATVDHYRVQQESAAAVHLGAVFATVAAGGSYTSQVFSLGAVLNRLDLRVRLAGEGATATLNGLYLGSGKQVVDHHTVIDHAVAGCSSHELYHGVLDGQASAVFNGKIFVRAQAQKTDAKQTNRVLLLSPNAKVHTKPQLEILADDVKCTHGATIGQLDPVSLFYLQSRGIDPAAARRMLTHAFASSVLASVKVPALAESLASWLNDRFAQEGEHQE